MRTKERGKIQRPRRGKKPAKIKPISVYLQIYRRAVVVFFEWRLEEIVMYGQRHGLKLSKEWVQSIVDATGMATGWAAHFGDDNSDIAVWVKVRPKKASQYGVLYHEIYHAVDLIAHDLDSEFLLFDKNGMSEPRAYLYEFIVNELNCKLWG